MWDKVGEFCLNTQSRRLHGVYSRNFVKQICQPHETGVVLHVKPPDCIVDNFIAYVYLLGQSLLREVHERCAYIEVLVELIVEVKTEERFALH